MFLVLVQRQVVQSRLVRVLTIKIIESPRQRVSLNLCLELGTLSKSRSQIMKYIQFSSTSSKCKLTEETHCSSTPR